MILSYLQTVLTLLYSLATEISLPETGSFQQHRHTRIRTHSLGTLISSLCATKILNSFTHTLADSHVPSPRTKPQLIQSHIQFGMGLGRKREKPR